MKILMTLVMTLVVSSAMAAECKLGGECKLDADCKVVNSAYAVIAGKCVDPKANEKDTKCPEIVSSGGAKAAVDAAVDSETIGSKIKAK